MRGEVPPVNVSLGLEIVDDLLPRARHDETGQVCLHTDDLDVDAVPGNGLKHLELHPLYVQDEPVHCGSNYI